MAVHDGIDKAKTECSPSNTAVIRGFATEIPSLLLRLLNLSRHRLRVVASCLLPCLEPHGRPLATYCELLDWLSRTLRKWVSLFYFSTLSFLPTLFIHFGRIKADSTNLFFTIAVGLVNSYTCHLLLSFDACLVLVPLPLIEFDYSIYDILSVSPFPLQWRLNLCLTRTQTLGILGLNYPTQTSGYPLLHQNLSTPEPNPPIP
jgi:hypothetical protein